MNGPFRGMRTTLSFITTTTTMDPLVKHLKKKKIVFFFFFFFFFLLSFKRISSSPSVCVCVCVYAPVLCGTVGDGQMIVIRRAPRRDERTRPGKRKKKEKVPNCQTQTMTIERREAVVLLYLSKGYDRAI